MAKKIVFDRVVGLAVSSSQEARVPNDELWKVTGTDRITVNSKNALSEATSHLVGGGDRLGAASAAYVYVVGIAFKVVEV